MGELTSDIVAVAGLLSLSVTALLSSLHMLSHHSTSWMNRFHLMMIKNNVWGKLMHKLQYILRKLHKHAEPIRESLFHNFSHLPLS